MKNAGSRFVCTAMKMKMRMKVEENLESVSFLSLESVSPPTTHFYHFVLMSE